MNINEFINLSPDLPGFINIKDLDEQLIWISNLWLQPLGYNRVEEIIGKKAYDVIELFTPAMVKQYRDGDKKPRQGQSWIGIQDTNLIGFGHINLITTKSPLYNENGTICGIITNDVPILNSDSCRTIQYIKSSSQYLLGKKALLPMEIVENQDDLDNVELEVLYYLLRQKMPKAIAALLNTSLNEVNLIIAYLKDKFNVNTTKQLIEVTVSLGYAHLIPKRILSWDEQNRLCVNDIKLTKRESECAQLLMQGLGSKLIANKLKLSPRTVEHHVENIKLKFNVSSKYKLVALLNSFLNC